MDPIKTVEASLHHVPLRTALSDAKVLTGRQRSLAHVDLLVVNVETRSGEHGFGFSYSLRAGGAALFAHARDLAPDLVGEDPNDIGRLWEKLAWAGASVSRTGVTVQAIAAFDLALWDLKAKRAGLSLGKLLGAYREAVPCYNTSGGYLNATKGEVIANLDASLQRGIGGIKLKVGQPDLSRDIERVAMVREHVGPGVPMMVDANQQWDFTTALRAGRILDQYNLTWLEEPISAYDYAGHARLTEKLDTPIATGEMLSSVAECAELVHQKSVTFLQPDAPRIGGVTPFLKIAALADMSRLKLAPHFVMEIHIHLACAYPHESWVEHIEWLEPAFEERLEIRDGQMHLPDRPGLGLLRREWWRGGPPRTASSPNGKIRTTGSNRPITKENVMDRRSFLGACFPLASSAFLLRGRQASAQEAWPSRPVTVIVPFAPGSSSDIIARALAQQMTQVLGKPFVVENRPGATGEVGARQVIRSAPDGYTLMHGPISVWAINVALRPQLGYDPVRQLARITQTVRTPNVLVVNPKVVEADDLPGLITWLKRNARTASYPSSGVGASDHLTMEMFKLATGTEMTHVPYSGGPPAITSVMGGTTQVSFQNLGAIVPQIQDKRLKPIFITSEARSSLLPEVPTAAEAGLRDFVVYSWQGFGGPAGLPPALQVQIHNAVVTALRSPQVRPRLEETGFEIVGNNSEDFAAFHEGEIARWQRVVRAGNILAD